MAGKESRSCSSTALEVLEVLMLCWRAIIGKRGRRESGIENGE